MISIPALPPPPLPRPCPCPFQRPHEVRLGLLQQSESRLEGRLPLHLGQPAVRGLHHPGDRGLLLLLVEGGKSDPLTLGLLRLGLGSHEGLSENG